MKGWIITTADRFDVEGLEGAVYIEADTEEEAAGIGLARILMEEQDRLNGLPGGEFVDPDWPSAVRAYPYESGTYYSPVRRATRVPDEFQCCGGFPEGRWEPPELGNHIAQCRNERTAATQMPVEAARKASG